LAYPSVSFRPPALFGAAFLLGYCSACALNPTGSEKVPLIYETEDANAADVYRSLAQYAVDLPDEISEFLSTGKGDPARIERIVAQFQAPLSVVERAAKSMRCEWKYATPLTPFPELPQTTNVLSVAKLLLARARVRFDRGEIDSALQDFAITYKLSLWCRIERFRLEQGRYPETLEQVGPCPVDPYDGKPFKYRRIVQGDDEAFVLTSAGREGDWAERMRILIEECRFDRKAFETRLQSDADSMGYTFWKVHRRKK
jgi:hypothetical protein